MKKLANFVVNKPKLIVILSLVLLIPALLGYIFTDVNYEILTYLPGHLDSVKGEKVLSETYHAGSTTMVIVEDMAPKRIVALKDKIQQVDNVKNVIWTDTVLDTSIPPDILPDSVKDIFYSKDNKYTMMFVQFDSDCTSLDEIEAVNSIKKVTKGQCMLSGLTAISADTKSITDNQAPLYVAVAVVLAIIIMMLTMDSAFLPFVLIIVLGLAIIYNMGTNIILGSISYITQCIAAILQLGVTLDYSIFLVNRYNEEKTRYSDNKMAMEKALTSSFTSLFGSSMTTLFGFLALCFMQLTLGFNIGIVMAKGVILGVLSVVIILPAYMLLLDKKIYKNKHKKFVPDFSKLTDFTVKHKKAFSILFVIILIPAIYLAANVKQYYNLSSSLPDSLDSSVALSTMKKEFNMTTSHFIIVDDSMDTKKIAKMEDEIKSVKGITSLIAYNQFIGTTIPDSIIPDEINQICKQGGYQLMLANSEFEAATDESNSQIVEIQNIVNKYDSDSYVTGEGALYNDLIRTTKVDFIVTNIISIIAIFVVIAITFKSFSIPVILIASIELAILINESISTIFGAEIPFIAPTMISCVQLGATVDYAILLTSRFKEELSKGYERISAIKKAARESMRSVFQSAMLFFFATFGVYLICSISIVKSICAMLARGSIISALVIIFFLTPLLAISEGIIRKTSKEWNFKVKANIENEIEVQDNSLEFYSDYTEFEFSDEDQ